MLQQYLRADRAALRPWNEELQLIGPLLIDVAGRPGLCPMHIWLATDQARLDIHQDQLVFSPVGRPDTHEAGRFDFTRQLFPADPAYSLLRQLARLQSHCRESPDIREAVIIGRAPDEEQGTIFGMA